jgi:hypothetical protein
VDLGERARRAGCDARGASTGFSIEVFETNARVSSGYLTGID